MLLSFSVWAKPQTTPVRPKQVAKAQQDVNVYTDMNRFMESRLKKLQGIVRRAELAQQKVRKAQLDYPSLDHQKALRTWQDIEKRARLMMMDIKRKLSASRKPPPHPRINQDLLLARLDGRQEPIASHRGTVVLMHFWATWCRPCIKEVDHLNLLYQRFRSEEFKVVAMSLDARKKDVQRFMSRKKLRFPVYMDSGRTVYQQVIGGAEILPRSLLINQDGQIVHAYAGAQHLAGVALSSDIRRLLAYP